MSSYIWSNSSILFNKPRQILWKNLKYLILEKMEFDAKLQHCGFIKQLWKRSRYLGSQKKISQTFRIFFKELLMTSFKFWTVKIHQMCRLHTFDNSIWKCRDEMVILAALKWIKCFRAFCYENYFVWFLSDTFIIILPVLPISNVIMPSR